MNHLRLRLSLSKTPAMVRVADCLVRPLPMQQEEVMIAMKTLYGYHNETSADFESSAAMSLEMSFGPATTRCSMVGM